MQTNICKQCEKPIYLHDKGRKCGSTGAMIHDYHCVYCDHCGVLGEDGIHECLADMLRDIARLEGRLEGKRVIYRYAMKLGYEARCEQLQEEAEALKLEIAAAKQKYKMKQRKALYDYETQEEPGDGYPSED